MGLGDRHANNILIDLQLGQLVHIDLGMMFEHGRRILPTPELVPFRLTRDVMDPIGADSIKGRFTDMAVKTLEQLRRHSEVLVGVVSVILYDPVSALREVQPTNAGKATHRSQKAISRMRQKLVGFEAGDRQMTCEQQVSKLIAEARDVDNLSRIYHGWMPFL